jgi:hypothetical protein
MLSALGNYGGPTQTMELLAGSPALGTGDPNATDGNGNPLTTDQRGFSRPHGSSATPDIGAFENQGADVATHFAVSAPSSTTAGNAFNFTVTALDDYNNQATGYNGTVHFSSSDPQASLPGNVTLTNGVGTFTATLKKAGNQTITATDAGSNNIVGTSAAISVSAGAVAGFAIGTPIDAVIGAYFTFTVTAVDQYGNTVTNFFGSIQFSSTDSAASLPPNSMLMGGVGTFTGTLNTLGNQTISVTDTSNTSIDGTSNAIAVDPVT